MRRKLNIALQKEFKDFTVNVFECLNDIPEKIMIVLYNHLSTPMRLAWFDERKLAFERGYYIIICDNDTVVATRFLNRYKKIKHNIYDKLTHEILKSYNYMIGNTLVTNPDYRGQGIASKLITISNKLILTKYDYVIGRTNNEYAAQLYLHLGVNIAYSEIIDMNNYVYYFYCK